MNAEPSTWITQYASELPPGSRVLDLACGAGRHTRWLAAAGHAVTAVDVDLAGVIDLRDRRDIRLLAVDLEAGQPWPLPDETFDAVVVTNYLHRPLFAAIRSAVAAGGMLLYETFARGNEQYGRPRNPDFLLEEGELIEIANPPGRPGEFEVLGFFQGFTDSPKPAIVQRIAARRIAP